ncbi:MAG: PspC domain-containing protein [Bacteroidetes bacterium]|nr:PspC domain-containing protein [Bacteroidota bacterium]
MIKTLSINLGGIVFQVDEDAYETLRRYLDSLNQYYKYTEGREEIVSDIESRLAEIFSESLAKSGFDVISLGDVEEVIEIMGRPEDFEDDGEAYDTTTSTDGNDSGATTATGSRRLYRDMDDGVLAGVCSGLTAYWGVKDPLWIRLAFLVLALFSGGTIALIYIILWIVLPEAVTNSQKLEMKGKQVNINNLEKKIREDVGRAGENLKEFATSERSRSALHHIVDAFGRVLGAIVKVAFVFLKILFAIIVIAIVIGLIAGLIGLIVSFVVSLPLSLKYIFDGSFGWLLALIGGFLVLVIPMLALIYLPFRVFGNKRIQNKHVTGYGVGFFVIGVILCFGAASIAASYFSERESVVAEEKIPHPTADTLYMSINDNEEDYDRLDYNLHFSNLFAFTKQLETASDWVEMDIVPSDDKHIYLERTYKSRGRSDKKARLNADAITYGVKYLADEVKFNPVFGLGEKHKWRMQSVKLKLKVPEGMVIAPGRDMVSILDDVDNSLNAGVHTVAGNRWIMTDGILEPVDSNLALGSEWSKRNMERKDYAYFDHLEIEGDVDVEIVNGHEFEVFLAAKGSLAREVEFDQDGSTLFIEREGWNWGDVSIGFIGNNSEIDPKIYISMPSIESLEVGGQAYVIATGFAEEALELEIGAQSSVTLAELDVESLTAELGGQAYLELIGKADRFELDAHAQSNMDGEDFRVGKLYIELSGQSDAEMIVSDKIEGSLYAQSSLEYWGSPEVDVSSHAQSSVTKRNN